MELSERANAVKVTLQSLLFFKIEAQQKLFASAVLNLYYLFDWGQC